MEQSMLRVGLKSEGDRGDRGGRDPAHPRRTERAHKFAARTCACADIETVCARSARRVMRFIRGRPWRAGTSRPDPTGRGATARAGGTRHPGALGIPNLL